MFIAQLNSCHPVLMPVDAYCIVATKFAPQSSVAHRVSAALDARQHGTCSGSGSDGHLRLRVQQVPTLKISCLAETLYKAFP
jgi:hypothetical protein